MKSYTDLSQSKKLAKFLPLESADMCWSRCTIMDFGDGELKVSYAVEPCNISQTKHTKEDIPCWSLAALLDLLELPTLEKNGIGKGKGKTGWMVTHYDVSGMRYDTTYHDNPIDACVSMIELLHGLKLL